MTRWDKSLLAMVAACALTACSASHETARQVASTDSLLVESRWRLATTTVPESRVELAIPVATLRSLPATGLADHQGQMGWPIWAVALAFIGGTVIGRTRLK